MDVYLITSDWDENVVTWSAPPTLGSIIDTKQLFLPENPVTFTIPENVLVGWRNGSIPNYGVYVYSREQGATQHNNYTTAGATEHPYAGLHPMLLFYVRPPRGSIVVIR